ncbi:MAG: ABC transporter substrate-binding protein [Bacteroidales bacterium]|nr:ABC transporter substrate-binding protein [Candidatus Sodaliphilus aphodohippi]
MKKLLAILLLGLAASLGMQAQDRAHILKVYNWADYLDMKLIQEFEQWYKAQTGEEVKIVYETFDINENMLMQIEKGHEDYDVVCPSDYIIERMLRNDLLQPIQKNFGKTPNYLNNVSPFAIDKFQQMAPRKGITVSDYTVGYMWGTTGFLYNAKYVKPEEITSWGALLNPKFKNNIYVKDAFRDVYTSLICYAKYDLIKSGKTTHEELSTNITDENISAVEKVLKDAKPQIAGWEVDFGKERMTQGKAWIDLTWSGDAMWAIEEAKETGVKLVYTVPQEGSNVWFDGWVIPKYAKNAKAASYFINFMCMPENAIRNMDETGYVSVISTPEVIEEMTDSTLNKTVDASYFFVGIPGADSLMLNEVFYPDKSVIDRCVLMHDCQDKTEKMLAMWDNVKGNNLNTTMIIFIAAAVLIIIGAIIYTRIRKNRKHHHRR